MAKLEKDSRGYWRLVETYKDGTGKRRRRYLKYIGKNPQPYRDDLAKAQKVLPAIQQYPDLALKGGQAALAEYKRRQLGKPPRETRLFRTIVIDPPWPIEKIEREERGKQYDLDYAAMSIEEIKTFRLPADPNGCHIYLWTTQRFLPTAFEVLEAWGVKYQCLMTWVKNVGFTPFSWMYSTEHCLFGRIGSLQLTQLGKRLDFAAKVREHSRKPEEFYALVRQVSPEPRIDIFSREKHEGFEQYGNETTKF